MAELDLMGWIQTSERQIQPAGWRVEACTSCREYETIAAKVSPTAAHAHKSTLESEHECVFKAHVQTQEDTADAYHVSHFNIDF